MRRSKSALPALVLFLASAAATRAEPTPQDPLVHVRALQAIAQAHGGNRAAGTPGYDRSADYVADQLRGAGYEVRVEEFTYPFSEERSPPVLLSGAAQAAAPQDTVRSLAQSGAGDVTAKLHAVDLALPAEGTPPASTSGCEASDFEGFQRGAIALLRRGTCPFTVKVQNAMAAGAVGAVIMNQGSPGQTDSFRGTLGQRVDIPVVGVSYELGLTLAERAGRPEDASARLSVDVVAGTRASKNVVAEKPGAEQAPVVVVGGHLDSVPEGPGMNDNGSGVAAILAAATRLAETPANAAVRLRFGFWGAEEVGLVGSRHHVEQLSEEERRRIALYINLDMVGSPNFVRVLMAERDVPGAAGIAARALLDYFASRQLKAEHRTPGPLGSYSTDTASFKAKGIPTIGLYTGAGEPKREEQAAAYGGKAGEPFDPCYHRACDTADNVSPTVLAEMSDALTEALRLVREGASP